MKSVLFMMIFTIFSFGMMAQSLNKTDEKGLKQGAWKKFYPNGNAKYSGVFKDNKPTGVFMRYYESGKAKAKMTYLEDGETAKTILYRESGKLLSKGFYSGKKKDSLWLYYAEDGQWISSREFFRNTIPEGKWITYYQESTQPAEEISWKNGKMNGDYVEFFIDGTLKFEAKYVDGFMQGEVKRYFPYGKIKGVGTYEDGRRIGEWIYYNELGEEELIDYYNNQGVLIKTEDLGEKEDHYYNDTTKYTEEDIKRL